MSRSVDGIPRRRRSVGPVEEERGYPGAKATSQAPHLRIEVLLPEEGVVVQDHPVSTGVTSTSP